jgi:hypothetical protein
MSDLLKQFANVPSGASDVVMTAVHPSHEEGGPCSECAFRRGTEASNTPHTVALARLCVEGSRPFHCHVHPGLCRGYVAAANVRGVPSDDDDERWAIVAGHASDVIGICIDAAKAAEEGSMTTDTLEALIAEWRLG